MGEHALPPTPEQLDIAARDRQALRIACFDEGMPYELAHATRRAAAAWGHGEKAENGP